MDRLIYTALSGVNASMQRQRVIASNLANARTIGFRAEQFDQRPLAIEGETLPVRAMNNAEVRSANMAAGEIVQTGNPLDLAMKGDALIAVQATDGSEAYTRRADLSLSPNGLLVNGEGFPVIGDSGPLTIPPGAIPKVAPDGTVLAADPATPDLPPQEIGRIKLASPQGSPIAKGLDGLFRVVGGGFLPNDLDASVITGTLEQSNVETTGALVEMIEAQRLFDMRTKLITTARDCDEGGAQLMRLS